MRHVVPVVALAILIVAGGCLGQSPSSDADQSPSTEDPPPCTARTVEYDVTIPEKPAPLNRTAARDLARSFERTYLLASLRARYDDLTISSATFRVESTERIDGGYSVTVNPEVFYSTERLTAKGGYPTTYRITDREFVRDGRTLACYSGGS